MSNIFSLMQGLECVVKAVAVLMVLTVVTASGINAFTFTKAAGGRNWISVAPIVSWTVTTLTTVLMVTRLDAYAFVIQRLGQFSGALDSLAHLHASIFVSLVIVTAARAFFVISEMDNGRYAGHTDVPTEVAKCKWLKLGEALARILIVVFLTLFAASFLKIVLPGSLADLNVAGRPPVLTDISRQCAEYASITRTMGFGSEHGNCILNRLADLPKDQLLRLADTVTGPMKPLLILTYLTMISWCIIVWLAASPTIGDRKGLRNALLLQVTIAGFSLGSLAIMLIWVSMAQSRSLSLFQPQSSGEFVSGALTATSIAGILVILATYGLLVFRLGSDLRIVKRTVTRWFDNRQKPAGGD